MANNDDTLARVRWARLRLQILGSLLASPADDGELAARITELASRSWRHPQNGESLRFSFKTIERWYYAARDAADPIATLARKVHSHAGTHPLILDALGAQIHALYAEHPSWTMQLHHDNLLAVANAPRPASYMLAGPSNFVLTLTPGCAPEARRSSRCRGSDLPSGARRP